MSDTLITPLTVDQFIAQYGVPDEGLLIAQDLAQTG